MPTGDRPLETILDGVFRPECPRITIPRANLMPEGSTESLIGDPEDPERNRGHRRTTSTGRRTTSTGRRVPGLAGARV